MNSGGDTVQLVPPWVSFLTFLRSSANMLLGRSASVKRELGVCSSLVLWEFLNGRGLWTLG